MKTAKEIFREHRLKIQLSDPDNNKGSKANRYKKVPKYILDAMEEYAEQQVFELLERAKNFQK